MIEGGFGSALRPAEVKTGGFQCMDGNGVMGAWPGKVTDHAHYAKTNKGKVVKGKRLDLRCLRARLSWLR